MRCRKHHSDFSSSIGVCASCVRERLSSIIAAQAQAEKQSEFRSRGGDICAADEDHPPPLVFLRSVSPYVHRTKSDEDLCSDRNREGNRRHRHQRFYSTPQIGPNCRTNNSANTTFVTTGSFDRKPKSKFSLWSKLFRSRSEKFEKNRKSPTRESHGPDSSSSSPSWFSTIFNNNRRIKQQSSLSTVEESIAGGVERRIERGMSPARLSDSDEECEGPGRSPISQKFQQSPMAAHGSAKRGRLGHKQNASASGFAFCLSPLVRASPNRNWNQKVTPPPPEISFSGNLRAPAKPHLCANRSRKIADFGRVNHNR